jgi:hypothetical protein
MLSVLYFAAWIVMAVGYYEFFGPGPSPSELVEDLEWWRPYGFAGRWESLEGLSKLADEGFPGALVPIGLFSLPPVVLLIVGFRLFKGAVLRTVCWLSALSLVLFVYYAYMAEGVWRFFGWRFPTVAVSFASVVAVMMFAPSLLRTLLERSRIVTALLLTLVFAGILLLSTEVTGTDPNLPFDISPWPVVPLFGFLLVGTCLAVLHGAAGIGAWLARRVGGGGGMAIGGLAAALVAGAMAFFVFEVPDAGQVTTLAVLGAVYALVCAYTGPEDGIQAARDAVVRLGAGIFLFAVIHVSNEVAISYQITARNETATKVLVALEDYKEKRGKYPQRLHHLVPDFVEEIPRPRIGLILNEDDEFIYSYFGASYALEFTSVQWVQCGYSPPFEFASYDEDEEETEDFEEEYADHELGDEEFVDPSETPARSETSEDRALKARLAENGLEGAWNCDTAPPKLW